MGRESGDGAVLYISHGGISRTSRPAPHCVSFCLLVRTYRWCVSAWSHYHNLFPTSLNTSQSLSPLSFNNFPSRRYVLLLNLSTHPSSGDWIMESYPVPSTHYINTHFSPPELISYFYSCQAVMKDPAALEILAAGEGVVHTKGLVGWIPSTSRP